MVIFAKKVQKVQYAVVFVPTTDVMTVFQAEEKINIQPQQTAVAAQNFKDAILPLPVNQVLEECVLLDNITAAQAAGAAMTTTKVET